MFLLKNTLLFTALLLTISCGQQSRPLQGESSDIPNASPPVNNRFSSKIPVGIFTVGDRITIQQLDEHAFSIARMQYSLSKDGEKVFSRNATPKTTSHPSDPYVSYTFPFATDWNYIDHIFLDMNLIFDGPHPHINLHIFINKDGATVRDLKSGEHFPIKALSDLQGE